MRLATLKLYQINKSRLKKKEISKQQFLYAETPLFYGLVKVAVIGLLLSFFSLAVNFVNLMLLIQLVPLHLELSNLYTLNLSLVSKVLAFEGLKYYSLTTLLQSSVALISATQSFLTLFLTLFSVGFSVKYGQALAKNNWQLMRETLKIILTNTFLILVLTYLMLIFILFYLLNADLHLQFVPVTKAYQNLSLAETNNLIQTYELATRKIIVNFAQIYLAVLSARFFFAYFNQFFKSAVLLHGYLKLDLFLNFTETALTFVLVLLFFYFTTLNIIAIALATVLTTALVFIFFMCVQRKLLPEFQLWAILKTKVNYFSATYHLLKFDFGNLANNLGDAIWKNLLLYFLALVAVRAHENSIYFVALLGVIMPIMSFFNGLIVATTKKVRGYFSYNYSQKHYERFAQVYFILTVYILALAFFFYFLASFCEPVTYGLFFLYHRHLNASDTLYLQEIMTITLGMALAMPTKQVFNNLKRVYLELILSLVRRYLFFVLFYCFIWGVCCWYCTVF